MLFAQKGWLKMENCLNLCSGFHWFPFMFLNVLCSLHCVYMLSFHIHTWYDVYADNTMKWERFKRRTSERKIIRNCFTIYLVTMDSREKFNRDSFVKKDEETSAEYRNIPKNITDQCPRMYNTFYFIFVFLISRNLYWLLATHTDYFCVTLRNVNRMTQIGQFNIEWIMKSIEWLTLISL